MKISPFVYSIFLFSIIFAESSALNATPFELSQVSQSDTKWTGVAVSSQDRIFVNFPRWSTIPYSVVEISGQDFIPYPDSSWNNYSNTAAPDSQFICVQSVYVDDQDFLWILDTGRPYQNNVVAGGAKLLKMDLATDSVINIIQFDSTIAPAVSYLNDIRVDTQRQYAFLTESGLGALIVVDILSGTSRRVLSDHYSTKAENVTVTVNGNSLFSQIHADGLALTPDRSYLYYKALTGYMLYRIPVTALVDTSLSDDDLANNVEWMGMFVTSDAIVFDSDGDLYFTSIEDNSIWRFNPSTLDFDNIITSDLLKWPDSFAYSTTGELYVTTSRILFPRGPHHIYKIIDLAAATEDDIPIGKPKEFYLLPNYPNPFNPITTIQYKLPQQSDVQITIYDMLGKKVTILASEIQDAGYKSIQWNAANVPSGMYFYQIKAGEYIQTRKMVLLK